MKSKTTYYCDMDGVLANFSGAEGALERYQTEKGFFAELKPIRSNVKAIKKLIAKGENVKILTTSPNLQADIDKMTWLKKYLPEIEPKNVIFARPKKTKISYVARRKRKHAILFDDYGKNLREWVSKGGSYGFKITNRQKKELANPMFTTLKKISDLVNLI